MQLPMNVHGGPVAQVHCGNSGGGGGGREGEGSYNNAHTLNHTLESSLIKTNGKHQCFCLKNPGSN